MNHIFKQIILLAAFTLFSSTAFAAELPFGGQTLSFPESTKIQLIGEINAAAKPLPLKSPVPDNRNEYQKLRDTFENMDQVGHVQYYQLVTSTEKGTHQAFFVTVRIPQENFSPDQWSALVPAHTEKSTFLGDYINNLDQKLKNNSGHPVKIETDLSEKFFLLQFEKPAGFSIKNQEFFASSGSILIDTSSERENQTVDTGALFIPLYFHHFAWQYQNDYYFCLLVTIDGERDFWKELPSSFYKNN